MGENSPTPWRAEKTLCIRTRSDNLDEPRWDYKLVCPGDAHDGERWLAHGIEKEEDARLMATAPELLAACKDAYALMEDFHEDGIAYAEKDRVYEALWAAITKAEGGS